MFPSYLPAEVATLTESTSIALAQEIKLASISTPLSQLEIATTYIHQGEGNTPILLIHGFDSSLLEFRRLIPLLKEKQSTWALDLFGFGFSQRNLDIPLNPENIKTHLYHFWKTLIKQPVILAGASMGGAAAIDFTLTYPEAVEKLILLDSAGLVKQPSIGKFMFPPIDYLATEFLRNPKVRQSISETAYFDKSFASLDARTCAALHLKCLNWNKSLIAFTKSGGYGSFASLISDIKQQTLIIWGKQDNIVGTKGAGKFAKAIPNSKLVWIDNCGHVPHLEKPQLTAGIILDFVG
ncbi:alpha/beta hydrolase [Waterburya agarophytonicola K14]|uniref:Alpha/beta hydrolase n=1 Tax=Waterburya agarophytonicola KI4 TaxID=2874699 RepID=A0A964BRR3_9CYAN|nr:alpha/beta hydrolase [Waterburya agarophytonicola]MCC0176986.1 alpha/beta hydrolase [Waterburya agarophytonicola KI4]